MKRHRNFEINSQNHYEKSLENELGAEWLTMIKTVAPPPFPVSSRCNKTRYDSWRNEKHLFIEFFIVKYNSSTTGYLLTIVKSRV